MYDGHNPLLILSNKNVKISNNSFLRDRKQVVATSRNNQRLFRYANKHHNKKDEDVDNTLNRFMFFRSSVALQLLTCWSTWMSGKKSKSEPHSWRIYYRPKCYTHFSTHAPLAADITALCAIYTTCGPYLLSYQGELSYQAAYVIKFLLMKYNINVDLNSIFGIEKTDNVKITLLSLVKCFPNVCCELYSIGVCGPMVPMNVLGKIFKSKKRALLCPLFPMVASELLFKEDGPNILPQLLWIAYSTNVILRKKKVRQKRNIQKIWSRLKQDIRCKLVDEETRVKLCKRWDILNEKLEINNLILSARNYSLFKLNDKLYKEPRWKTIKEEMNDFYI